jgi:hypothetical protein
VKTWRAESAPPLAATDRLQRSVLLDEDHSESHFNLALAYERRGLVHREDERAAGLRATGAEVVVGDLTVPMDVARVLEGCQRIYFGMSVSPPYLEATVIAATVAREGGDIEAFVNISQMTVSQMSLTNKPPHLFRLYPH